MSFPSSKLNSNCGELFNILAQQKGPFPKQPLSRKRPTFTFGVTASVAFVDAVAAASDIMLMVPLFIDCAILIVPKLLILVVAAAKRIRPKGEFVDSIQLYI